MGNLPDRPMCRHCVKGQGGAKAESKSLQEGRMASAAIRLGSGVVDLPLPDSSGYYLLARRHWLLVTPLGGCETKVPRAWRKTGGVRIP